MWGHCGALMWIFMDFADCTMTMTNLWSLAGPQAKILPVVKLKKSPSCYRVQNSFCFLFCKRLFFFGGGFLSWYHLPYICNSLELEPVILHGICYILAWSLGILHCICHILALIWMVVATFWYLKPSCGFLVGFFKLSSRASFRISFRVSFRGFFRVSFGFL